MERQDTNNAPVFVFSAGWRSGSTLVQRLLCSSKQILVWGESGGALNDFSDAYLRYLQMLGPGGARFKHGYGGNGAEQFKRFISSSAGDGEWVACMNPDMFQIQSAIKNTINSIYRDNAISCGYNRWGVKEVLAGKETAVFLKELYPQARFIFLVRNPFDTLGSIKQRQWMDLKQGQDPVTFFGSIWRDLARDFRECQFGLKIRYEDLVSDSSVIQRIRDHIDIENLPDDFVSKSKANWRSDNNTGLGFIEKLRLKHIVAEEMRHWRY